MTDKWKQIAAGTVISITGVLGLTGCENKNENQEENKKPLTEQDPHWKEEGRYVIVKNTTYDFPAPNSPDGKEISQKQQKPEKKAPPKGSISKDAFINELLARSRSRNGKK